MRKLLILVFLLIVGCQHYNEPHSYTGPVGDEELWEKAMSQNDWEQSRKYVAYTENAPVSFNCSEIAWFIENNIYPEIVTSYNTTKYQTNEQILYQTHIDLITKDTFDDYYFRKCLTKRINYEN